MTEDQYTKVEDVKSTADTSTLEGRRTAEQILNMSDGKASTVLDSTVETSTTSPRSAEEIMKQMKEEDDQKSASAKSSVKSRANAMLNPKNKWKMAGVNVRPAKEEGKENALSDVADDVANIGKTAEKLTGRYTSVANALTAGLSAFGITKASEAAMDASDKEDKVVIPVAAPTDMAIAAYQKNVKEAAEQGYHVKALAYTDEQQRGWDAQDQHRMYANYANMYAHGENEKSYNLALLNAAMAVAGMDMPAKALSAAMTLKQKFLAAVQMDDDKLDINSLTPEKIIENGIDLLSTHMKEAKEDLFEINRDTETEDKFAAEDHQLDARDQEKKDFAESVADAVKESTKKFTDSFFVDRGKQAEDVLNVADIINNDKQDDLEAGFF